MSRPKAGSLEASVWRAAELCLDKKAEEVLVLDLRGLTSVTDFFVLATGTSDTQVRAISDHLVARLEAAHLRPWHMEGYAHGWWVLIDYVDFVVHIFHPEARGFYQLERLWGDAKIQPIED